MGNPIEIKFGDKALRSRLKKLAGRSVDLSVVLRQISHDMLDAVEENFAQQGRPRWKPLAESTIARRKKRGTWPGRILQEHGELAAAVTPFSSTNEAGVSVAKRYAAIHQFGGKAGRGRKVTIPARPYLSLPEEALKGISARLNKHLRGG